MATCQQVNFLLNITISNFLKIRSIYFKSQPGKWKIKNENDKGKMEMEMTKE